MTESSIFTALYNERKHHENGAQGGGGSPSVELAQASRRGKMIAKSLRAKSAPRGYVSARADKINTVVKSNWVRNDKKATARLRGALRYNQERERGQEEKERAFYTKKEEKIDREDIRDQIKDKFGKDIAFHTVIFSPGDNNINIKEFTRETMEEWQKQLGYELDYYAIEHRNTEHYHAHIIMPGSSIDKIGDVRFNREDLNNLREIANDLLARERMIDRAFDRAVAREFGFDKQDRYDRDLQKEFHMSFRHYKKDQEVSDLSTFKDFAKDQKDLGLGQEYDFSGKEWRFDDKVIDDLYGERSQEKMDKQHSWDRELTPVLYEEKQEENTADRWASNTRAINKALMTEDERERDDDDDESRRRR